MHGRPSKGFLASELLTLTFTCAPKEIKLKKKQIGHHARPRRASAHLHCRHSLHLDLYLVNTGPRSVLCMAPLAVPGGPCCPSVEMRHDIGLYAFEMV